MTIRLLILAFAAPALAQTPAFTLGPRTGAIRDLFSDAVGMAEWKDGRVIIADRIDKAFFVADFATGQRKVIGRNGIGPNEYQTPFGVIRWRGDTLLGYDPNNRRLLQILQDGTIAGMFAFPSPRVGGINAWAAPRGVDPQGRVYWDAPIIDMGPPIKRLAEANLVRWLPGADSVEAAMRIADHGAFEHAFRYRPMPQADGWVVGADGRIGVISSAQYVLRWYKDGKVVETGPPVPHVPRKVTAAEREAFRERKALEPASGASTGMGGAATSRTQSREMVAQAWPDSIFPAIMPPFEPRGVFLAANGDIWVNRSVGVGEPPRVDILDSHGKLRGVLSIPPGKRLFALGSASVYLIAADSDGLQTLERVALPSGLGK